MMNRYAKNVYSQNGEDGILEELLRRLGIRQGWVCEFGAWDGKHLSNTFHLIEQGFRGVFIEGDSRKYMDLVDTARHNPTIKPILAFVTEDGETSLDSLLSKTDIPEDFDVLSIDIDSSDYQVWRGVQRYSPKIVIIEINSGIHPSERYVYGDGAESGSSFRSMLELGVEKEYTFVCHTGNMIFVRNDLVDKLGSVIPSPPESGFLMDWVNARKNASPSQNSQQPTRPAASSRVPNLMSLWFPTNRPT